MGFEPTDPCGSPVFKTGAIDHSATPPLKHNAVRADRSKIRSLGKWGERNYSGTALRREKKRRSAGIENAEGAVEVQNLTVEVRNLKVEVQNLKVEVFCFIDEAECFTC